MQPPKCRSNVQIAFPPPSLCHFHAFHHLGRSQSLGPQGSSYSHLPQYAVISVRLRFRPFAFRASLCPISQAAPLSRKSCEPYPDLVASVNEFSLQGPFFYLTRSTQHDEAASFRRVTQRLVHFEAGK